MTLNRRTLIKTGLAAGAVGALSTPSLAASGFPNRPIRIICTLSAGGLSDTLARAYAQGMSEKLGQPVVVENKPGSGSILGCREVAESDADGHTLLYTISTALVQNQKTFADLPYNPERDFDFLGLVMAGKIPLAVLPDMPVQNLAEFVAYAKSNPINFGTYAHGAYPHMVCHALNKAYGLDMEIVAYKGETPLWQDMAAQVLEAGMGSYGACRQQVEAGTAKIIAMVGKERLSAAPDVPTFIEQGFDLPLFGLDPWHGILAPKGLPADIFAALEEAIIEAGKGEVVGRINSAYAIDQGAMGQQEFLTAYEESKSVLFPLIDEMGLAKA